MIWFFLSVLLIVVVYLAIQFPAVRKGIKVFLTVLFIVVAGVLLGFITSMLKRTSVQNFLAI